MTDFPYRTVAVLGATSGLGRALASAIHDLPSEPRVIVTGRRTDRLSELAREKGSDRIVPRKYDQSVSPEQLKDWVDDLLRDEPTLDCVVLMAGIQHVSDPAKPETVQKILEDEMRMNFFAIVSLVSAFTPHFVQLGNAGKPCVIATVTSGISLIPNPWNALYCASKAAVRSYTLSCVSGLDLASTQLC